MVRRALSLGFVVLVVMLASCKKTQSAEPVLTKCASDADCVYTMKGRGDCCVNPCGGTPTPVHKDEAAAIVRYNEDYCTTARREACPQAGACGRPPEGPKSPPKCASGACVSGT
ncbi:MAG: hypothetical protein U0270_26165 [Labilithrix sp.]|mgnify:CR=1 FL=1